MSEQSTEREEGHLTGPQALGATLRAAREARGLSLAQLGALLKIDNTRLRWMEEGRFADFRQPIFVRGYLRSCARHLDLNEQELLAQFDALFPNAELVQTTVPKRRPPPPLQRGNRAIKFSALAFVLVLIGLWLVLGGGAKQLSFSELELEALPLTIRSTLPIDEPSPAQTTAVEFAPPLAPPPSVALGGSRDVAQNSLMASAPETVTPAEASADATDEDEVEEQNVPDLAQTTAAVESELVLEFSGECWVEIRNGGRVLHANMQRAGDRLELTEMPPYQVLLGDARWVSVTYNGDRVPVHATDSTYTARFTIGDES